MLFFAQLTRLNSVRFKILGLLVLVLRWDSSRGSLFAAGMIWLGPCMFVLNAYLTPCFPLMSFSSFVTFRFGSCRFTPYFYSRDGIRFTIFFYKDISCLQEKLSLIRSYYLFPCVISHCDQMYFFYILTNICTKRRRFHQ